MHASLVCYKFTLNIYLEQNSNSFSNFAVSDDAGDPLEQIFTVYKLPLSLFLP